MGLALRKRPAPLAPPRPLLLYCRPAGEFTEQDDHVAALACEQGLDVETCAPPDAARRLRTWVSAIHPTLLVLRAGEIVSIAVGRLPRHALECLVALALV